VRQRRDLFDGHALISLRVEGRHDHAVGACACEQPEVGGGG
jgi:hypothetical protein